MEPELPKLPKNKIKPNIQPNKIIGGGKVTYISKIKIRTKGFYVMI